jgi:hypothetical protein
MFGRGAMVPDYEYSGITDNPLVILILLGFFIWVIIDVAKKNDGAAKALLALFIGLPILGFLLNYVFDGIGSFLRWVFSKDAIGTLLGFVFFFLALKVIGNTLLKDEEKKSLDERDSNK